MDFELKEEHRMIRDMVRDFVKNEIEPIANKIDEEEIFPEENVRKMGELGLMGMEIPVEYGGSGMDSLSYVIVVEEISKVCPSHGVILSVNNSLFCYGVYKFGTEEQKREILPIVASGKKIGAFSLTEPHTGSDASNLKTRAVKDGTSYVINGKKVWVTNGTHAKFVLLFAVTDPEKKHHGITCFIVDTEKEGIIKSPPEKKLGIRAAYSCELTFEDYRIPEKMRLGNEGEGFKIAMSILDAGRIGIAAQAVGISQGAFEHAVKYSLEREAFGKKLCEHQAIQFYLAEMRTKIEAARLLTYKAAFLKQKNERFSEWSSMAKLYAAETAMWVCDKAVQIHGSLGYSREHDVQRLFRAAKVTEIYEGTSEIQKIVISRGIINEMKKLYEKV
ncbi:MAG: acyl-CoA dehydrogenase [Candidatus Hydrothermales bacterium]